MCHSLNYIFAKKFLFKNEAYYKIIDQSYIFILFNNLVDKIIEFIEIVSRCICLTFNCFISIIFFFRLLCLLLWWWKWLFNQERTSTFEQLEFYLSIFSIASVRCLFFLCSTHIRKIVSIMHLQTRLVPHRFIFCCPQ